MAYDVRHNEWYFVGSTAIRRTDTRTYAKLKFKKVLDKTSSKEPVR